MATGEFMSQDWNIKAPGMACGGCQKTFTDRETYFTRLVFSAKGYERMDHCEACWKKELESQPRYGAWKGVYRVPPPPRERKVKKEAAEALLRELVEGNEPGRTNAIYILAVMLERQRLFLERELRTDEPGIRRIVYEHRKTGETFVIVDPQLKLGDLDSVQREIMDLLAGEPAAKAAASSAAGGDAAPGGVPAG